MAHAETGTPTFYVYIVIIIGLVLFAGLMSGLTLGLMSLSLVDLEVLQKSGTPADQKHAGKILPVVRKQHLLLCTLLIGNALAMEALPIFLDSLVEAWGAILISVTLILLFGEIIPQAVCSRYGLAVGAAMSPIVKLLLVVFFPIAYPISKLLDAILGKRHGSLFRRSELITLVDFHGDEAGKGGELTHDETTIIAGALKLTNKTAEKAMTAIEDVFALNVDDKLDMEKMRTIKATGHSRIPVFAGDKNNIIGLLLVKNLLTLPPQDETPVRDCTFREIPWVPVNAPLYDILNDFQKGHSHMAVVFKNKMEKTKYASQEGLSVQRKSSRSLSRDTPPSQFLSNNVDAQSGTISSAAKAGLGSQNIVVDIPGEDSTDGESEVRFGYKKLVQRMTLERKHGNESRTQPAIVKLSEEGTRGQIIPQQTPKKRVNVGDRGGSRPGDANDKEVVGIITMEDLIEELLQEEILDETDVYVDIHNKIKVNMQPPGGRSPASPLSDSTPMASPGVGSKLRNFPDSPRSWAPNTHSVMPVNSISPCTSPPLSPLRASSLPSSKTKSLQHTSP